MSEPTTPAGRERTYMDRGYLTDEDLAEIRNAVLDEAEQRLLNTLNAHPIEVDDEGVAHMMTKLDVRGMIRRTIKDLRHDT